MRDVQTMGAAWKLRARATTFSQDVRPESWTFFLFSFFKHAVRNFNVNTWLVSFLELGVQFDVVALIKSESRVLRRVAMCAKG